MFALSAYFVGKSSVLQAIIDFRNFKGQSRTILVFDLDWLIFLSGWGQHPVVRENFRTESNIDWLIIHFGCKYDN